MESKLREAARALSQSPRGGLPYTPELVHVRKRLLENLDAALSAPEEPDGRDAVMTTRVADIRAAETPKPLAVATVPTGSLFESVRKVLILALPQPILYPVANTLADFERWAAKARATTAPYGGEWQAVPVLDMARLLRDLLGDRP